MKFTILLIRVFLLVSAILFLAFSNAGEQHSQSKNQIFAEVAAMDEALMTKKKLRFTIVFSNCF